MEKITGKENTDDEIRAILIDALESKKANDFDKFCAAVLPGIEGFLKKYPVVWETIGESLRKIKAKKIMVVESGCSGTFPMMLRAMDERVKIRMYTTYLYLLDCNGHSTLFDEVALNFILCIIYDMIKKFVIFFQENGQILLLVGVKL